METAEQWEAAEQGWFLDNSPHSVYHQPGRPRNLLRKERSLCVATCAVFQHKYNHNLCSVNFFIHQILRDDSVIALKRSFSYCLLISLQRVIKDAGLRWSDVLR